MGFRHRLNLFLNFILIVLQFILVFTRVRFRVLYLDNSSFTTLSPSLHSFSVNPPLNVVLLFGLISNLLILFHTKRSDSLSYVLLFLINLVFHLRVIVLFAFTPLLELPSFTVSPFLVQAKGDLLLFNSIHVVVSAILSYLVIESLVEYKDKPISAYGFQNVVFMFVFIVHATRLDRSLSYFGIPVPANLLLPALMIFPLFLIFHGGFQSFYRSFLRRVSDYSEGKGWRFKVIPPFLVVICISASIIFFIVVAFLTNSAMGLAFTPDFAFLTLSLILFSTIVLLLSASPRRGHSLPKVPKLRHQRGMAAVLVLLLMLGTMGFQFSAIDSDNDSAQYTIFDGTVQGSVVTGRLFFTNTFTDVSEGLHYVYYDRVILFEFDFASSALTPMACLEIKRITIDGVAFVNETLVVTDGQFLSLQLNETIGPEFSQPIFLSLGINSAGTCLFSTLPSSVVNVILG